MRPGANRCPIESPPGTNRLSVVVKYGHMPLRKSFLAAPYYRLIETRVLPRVNRLTLGPNHFTLIGFFLAAAAPVGFFLHPLIGFFFILTSAIADTLDGLMARHRNAASTLGAFLDSSLDRISDFFYLFGFWILFWHSERHILAASLIFASFLTTAMISYVQARSEALGGLCGIGWMERGWRTVFLIVWALLVCVLPASREPVLWTGLGLYLLLTGVTVLQRLIYCSRKFARPIK